MTPMKAGEQQAALDRARQGDRQALGELLDSFRPYLRFIGRAAGQRRLQARLDDSDLVQDVLLEAHRQFARFRGSTVAELTAWLRQIVLRTAGHARRSHLDAGKRTVDREQSADDLTELASPDSTPSAQAIRDEQAARMAGALARLPEEMQQVLLGRHLEQQPYAVLAERLGKSEGALRVLYVRALERLRQACQE
jgi:RNA polymerase sigma-70 factor (ECF subfamily)